MADWERQAALSHWSYTVLGFVAALICGGVLFGLYLRRPASER